MKSTSLAGRLLSAAVSCGCLLASAEGEVKWIDGRTLPVEGKAFADTRGPYDRLPAEAEGRVTESVWRLSHDTSGLLFRFRTDSDFIQVRWDLPNYRLAMPNMASCGKSGFDVYRKAKDGKWRFVRAFAPSGKTNNVGRVKWTPGEECVINFPLYNAVERVEVGVGAKAKVEPVAPKAKPIVWYGVSTTQGCSASRPGMSFPAIVSRRLDVPFVNLGFSASGKMEMEMCDYVAGIEASAYVIDTPGNMSAKLMRERYEKFLRELHRRRPDTPIVLAEQRINSSERSTDTDKNLFLRSLRDRLTAEGGWRLQYVASKDMFPLEADEVTVDSPDGHPSDLGMWQLANAYQKAVSAALGR